MSYKKTNLIELFVRKFPTLSNRKDKIVMNGYDNAYPERTERIIDNSITAKMAVTKWISFVVGKGFVANNDKKITKSGLTTHQVLSHLARDLGYHKAFAWHINYDAQGNPKIVDVIPFKKVRKTEEDKKGNTGLLFIKDNWDKFDGVLRKNRNKRDWLYPYNPNIEIINEQRNDDNPDASPQDKIKKFRGQLYISTLEPHYIYPSSFIEPASDDADSEFRIGQFRNNRLKNGFLGATIFFTRNSEDEDGNEISMVDSKELQVLLGSDGANLMQINVNVDGDAKIKDYVHVEQIKGEVDTQQFIHDEKKIEEHILQCWSVPRVLIQTGDGSMFGANGETLMTAEKMFQITTGDYRKHIEQSFQEVLGVKMEITPLIEENVEENVDENKKAQAVLRGSVGGVRALLEVQQSVQAKTTDKNSAIAILENIYGFEESVATEILGEVIEALEEEIEEEETIEDDN